MDNNENDQLSSLDLEVDNEVRQLMMETSKWTKFISLSMFIIGGLILLFGILGGSLMMGVLGKVKALEQLGNYKLYCIDEFELDDRSRHGHFLAGDGISPCDHAGKCQRHE